MRLEILNSGYSSGTKLLFGVIQTFSRQSLPDAAKLVFYRPGFYGKPAKKFTQEAMRGPSAWSVADRELMAAYVSKVNETAFCIGAHTATAGQAYQDPAKVQAVLTDLDSAPIGDSLRATLRMLGKLTREGKVDAGDGIPAYSSCSSHRRQLPIAVRPIRCLAVTSRQPCVTGNLA